MREFPASPITALIDQTPRYNLGESMGADLTVAELLGPDELGPDGLAGVRGVRLGYGTSTGDPELRALVAARHGIPDGQVLITAGAAAALFLVSLLCGDGEVVLGQPGYPPTLSTLRGIGAPVVTVLARFEDGYRVDLDAFDRRLSPRTQLVIFASPQNPSGVPLTEDEVERMLAAMSRTCPEALLLIDETFREATYGGAPPAASFAGRSPRLLTCGSMSKAYGAPGLRIGWLTVPEPGLCEQLRLARFNTSLSCGSLDEFLAARLLSQADRVLAARGAVLAGARGIVERWIKGRTWPWGGCDRRPARSAACASNRVPSGPRRSTASTRTWPSSECWSRPAPGSATARTLSGSAWPTSRRTGWNRAWRSSARPWRPRHARRPAGWLPRAVRRPAGGAAGRRAAGRPRPRQRARRGPPRG